MTLLACSLLGAIDLSLGSRDAFEALLLRFGFGLYSFSFQIINQHLGMGYM